MSVDRKSLTTTPLFIYFTFTVLLKHIINRRTEKCTLIQSWDTEETRKFPSKSKVIVMFLFNRLLKRIQN